MKKVSFSVTIYKPKEMHVIQVHIRNAFIYQTVDKRCNKRRKKESTSPKRTTDQGDFFRKAYIYSWLVFNFFFSAERVHI